MKIYVLRWTLICSLPFLSGMLTWGCGGPAPCTSNKDCKNGFLCVTSGSQKSCVANNTNNNSTNNTNTTNNNNINNTNDTNTNNNSINNTNNTNNNSINNTNNTNNNSINNTNNTNNNTNNNNNRCPSSCNDGSECASCGAGYACQQNKCAPLSSDAGLNQECNETNKKCQAGLICMSLSKKDVCFQDCSADTTLCQKNTDGRTQCTEVDTDENGNPIKICFGTSEVGEACYNGTRQFLCKENQTPPHYCSSQDGTCKVAQVVTKEGDACSKYNDETDPYKVCDEKQGLACNENSGTCVKNKGFGAICAEDCSSAFECFYYDENSTDGFCSQDCTNSNTCPGYTNGQGKAIAAKCEDMGDGSKYCLFPCGNGELCPDKTTCQDIGDGSKFCFAP